MAVYVDDFRARVGRMKMCHMIADSREELLRMVDQLGVNRKWLQHEGRPTEHFDIALSKRDLALSLGAQLVSTRQIAAITRSRRPDGVKVAAPRART